MLFVICEEKALNIDTLHSIEVTVSKNNVFFHLIFPYRSKITINVKNEHQHELLLLRKASEIVSEIIRDVDKPYLELNEFIDLFTEKISS